MFRSPKARAAGLVYLDEEACSFRITPEDRLWTVFGSPVSLSPDARPKFTHAAVSGRHIMGATPSIIGEGKKQEASFLAFTKHWLHSEYFYRAYGTNPSM